MNMTQFWTEKFTISCQQNDDAVFAKLNSTNLVEDGSSYDAPNIPENIKVGDVIKCIINGKALVDQEQLWRKWNTEDNYNHGNKRVCELIASSNWRND